MCQHLSLCTGLVHVQTTLSCWIATASSQYLITSGVHNRGRKRCRVQWCHVTSGKHRFIYTVHQTLPFLWSGWVWLVRPGQALQARALRLLTGLGTAFYLSTFLLPDASRDQAVTNSNGQTFGTTVSDVTIATVTLRESLTQNNFIEWRLTKKFPLSTTTLVPSLWHT